MFIYLHMRVISSPGCSIRSLHPVAVGCSTYGFFTLVFSVGVTGVGGNVSLTGLLFSDIVREEQLRKGHITINTRNTNGKDKSKNSVRTTTNGHRMQRTNTATR